MTNDRVSGRAKSIPPEVFDTVWRLYAAGHGYRTIAKELQGLGISVTYSSVRRLIKCEGAYSKIPRASAKGRMSSYDSGTPSTNDPTV